MPSITIDDVEAARALSPKRFRFLDNPAVREHQQRGHHTVGLKFPSVKRLFEADTGIQTLDGPYGPYKFLTDPAQISTALAWQTKHESHIFLRDNLVSSIALDFSLAEAGVYTELGQAEHSAKTSRDLAAIGRLSSACEATVKAVSFYNDCTVICAIPPSPEKEWDLPTEIAERVASKTGKRNLSGEIEFLKKKESVKSLLLEDKWQALEDAKLSVSGQLKGERIILIDDKYQSGTTVQFVASKLYRAGAREVHGLFCVKTWRDTDNT
jgi:hypothetical protein